MATTINAENKPKAILKAEITAKEVDKAISTVIKSYNGVEKSFLSIACNLKFLQSDDNYKKASTAVNATMPTFETFARHAFGFKKSQAYALCNLVDRFGVKNDDGMYYISHDYDVYTQTQLISMIKLSDEQIAQNINPGMSVSEIKKKVKELCSPPPKDTDNGKTKKSKTITASNGTNVVNTTSANSQALISYKSFDDFNADIKNIVAMVATVFKKNPNYRITVNYEWTPKADSNADVNTDAESNVDSNADAELNADSNIMNPPASDSDGNTTSS